MRSSLLSRHLAPGTAPRGASRLDAARHALRTRAAGRRRAILLALGLLCAGLLIAVPLLFVITGAPDDDGRTGDDGVFSDETEGGTRGQGGAGIGTEAFPTPSSGSTGPRAGDPVVGGAAGVGSDLTGTGGGLPGMPAIPGTGGAGGTGGPGVQPGDGAAPAGGGSGTAAGQQPQSNSQPQSNTQPHSNTQPESDTQQEPAPQPDSGTQPPPSDEEPCLCEQVGGTVTDTTDVLGDTVDGVTGSAPTLP